MPTTSPALPAAAVRRSLAVPVPAADAAAARTGRGLGGALLGYLVAVTLVITLAPFDFRAFGASSVRLEVWTPLDLVANVLLFAPLGFLYAQARRGGRAHGTAQPGNRRLVYDALWLGLALSTAIELLQFCVPARYPSPWDVLANGAGAGLGTAAYAWVHRRLDPARMVGRLGLELPLIGIVYLLVPLGWVSALSLRAAPERWWLLLCLGFFGGSILGAAQRRHFGPGGLFSARGMAIAATGWFVLCALPALAVVPRQVALGALSVGAVTWYLAAMLDGDEDRRFELVTLLRAGPYFAAYLLLLVLSAPDTGMGFRRSAIFQMMETLAAFTLLGYMTAESQGRRELAPRAVLPLVAAVAGTLALAMGAARTAGLLSAAELPALAVSVAAALYGGWLYHLQRAHVRALVRGSR